MCPFNPHVSKKSWDGVAVVEGVELIWLTTGLSRLKLAREKLSVLSDLILVLGASSPVVYYPYYFLLT